MDMNCNARAAGAFIGQWTHMPTHGHAQDEVGKGYKDETSALNNSEQETGKPAFKIAHSAVCNSN